MAHLLVESNEFGPSSKHQRVTLICRPTGDPGDRALVTLSSCVFSAGWYYSVTDMSVVARLCQKPARLQPCVIVCYQYIPSDASYNYEA